MATREIRGHAIQGIWRAMLGTLAHGAHHQGVKHNLFNQVCQGNMTPKKCAVASNNTCCPIKLAKESLKVKLGAFTF